MDDNGNPCGYTGWIGKKEILKPILDYKTVKECYTIDDDYIGLYLKHKKINLEVISYDNIYAWDSSFDKEKTDEHPKWDELNKENRLAKQKKCEKEFYLLNN
tara:strand:- start:239 stop:544 length:306 start_codon:yes stop_codon:yes gene_type:complete